MVFALITRALLPTLATAGGLYARSSCYWHVTKQTLLLEKPAIYEFPVEVECPHGKFGVMHEDICTQCDALDNQCAGEFVACTGCCELQKSARSHSCDHIQKYFSVKNTMTLQCDARMNLEDEDVNVAWGEDTTERKDSGTLKSECKVDDKKAVTDDDLVPVKLKFDCSNCATEGVPDLLRQCCEKASDFATSVMVQELQSQGAKVFLWADGCHNSLIGPEDNRQQFTHKFPTLTEEKIDADMDAYVQNTYCSKTVDANMDKCPASGGYRRLQGNSPWQWLSPFALKDPADTFVSNAEYKTNSSRQLNADPGCHWLSAPSDATSATSVTETPEFHPEVDGACDRNFPLVPALLGGGFASLSLV